jgi:hypothetical protein
MMCYRDMTFCASDCTNAECFRHLTPEIERKAKLVGLDLALSDFHETCASYRPPGLVDAEEIENRQ